ncbi:hypothetical protein F3Y22_tig00110770pilonHSYRG00013 [Hibiscus syriacus]|uniref:Uncharacterized protein n=1 Tax=Hibiscus syriacus TaxID=106335 RepID=A0A6A2ZTS0_HIBSY|nr:hypothetical protein F3Y22_tig00110770pilonHSYRG00013 [Hibiscus syriacus]
MASPRMVRSERLQLHRSVLCTGTGRRFATVVAGIDLNHANIAGYFPDEIGLLTDLALFHFSGEFPYVVLYLPSLKYLDIRFNQFSGRIPSQLFDLKLDALFFNDKQVSIIHTGKIRKLSCVGYRDGQQWSHGVLSIVEFGENGINSEGDHFDEQWIYRVFETRNWGLNVANNKLSGYIPESICSLPNLNNFNFSNNFFVPNLPNASSCEPKMIAELIPYRPLQNPPMNCKSFYAHPIHCTISGCSPLPHLHHSPSGH